MTDISILLMSLATKHVLDFICCKGNIDFRSYGHLSQWRTLKESVLFLKNVGPSLKSFESCKLLPPLYNRLRSLLSDDRGSSERDFLLSVNVKYTWKGLYISKSRLRTTTCRPWIMDDRMHVSLSTDAVDSVDCVTWTIKLR